MAHLIADSTNRVTYTPLVDLDTLTLTIETSDASSVTYTDTVTEQADGSWAVDLTSSEITSSYLYDTLKFTWELTYTSCGTQVRTDIEYFDVLTNASSDRLVTIRDVKNHLGITDATDDEFISGLIDQALAALSHWELPTVPKTTEARYLTVYDHQRFIFTPELVSLSGVVDDSGTTVDADYYTVAYARDGASVRGITLEADYSGQLTVSGTWGYDDCPADVVRAMLITVGTWYKRARYGDSNDVVGGFATLPREAADIMNARMRVSV